VESDDKQAKRPKIEVVTVERAREEHLKTEDLRKRGDELLKRAREQIEKLTRNKT
jgi:hypothetical protein